MAYKNYKWKLNISANMVSPKKDRHHESNACH